MEETLDITNYDLVGQRLFATLLFWYLRNEDNTDISRKFF